MPIFSTQNAVAFVTADGSTIREFLNPRNSGLQNQSLAQATLAPDQKTSAHFHPLAEEIYFIQAGQAQMWLENEAFEVRAGDCIPIRAGQRHQIKNTGQTALVFLCCCAPAYTDEDTTFVPDMTGQS